MDCLVGSITKSPTSITIGDVTSKYANSFCETGFCNIEAGCNRIQLPGAWQTFQKNIAGTAGTLLTISDLSEIIKKMKEQKSKLDDELDSMVRALASPVRRQILELVWNSQFAAGDIATKLGLANASVSEHLKVLRKAELIYVEKDGTWWFYQANKKRLNSLIELLKTKFPFTES